MQPRTISAACAAALASVLALAFTPAPAQAKFGRPFTLSSKRVNSNTTQVATNANGDTIVVWREVGNGAQGTLDKIKARVRPARGNFFRTETVQIADPGCCGLRDPHVAIDEQGNAIAVWSNLNVQGTAGNLSAHIEASFRPAGGPFGPVEALGCSKDEHILCPLGLEPQVAMNAEGDAVIAWHGREFFNGFTGDKGVFATVRPAGGPFGPATQLEGLIDGSSNQVIPAFNVRAAIDADGDALMAWKSEPEGLDVQIVARSLSAAGALGKYKVIRPVANISFFGPELAMDGPGNAIVVWFDATLPVSAVRERSRSAAGVWKRPPKKPLAEGRFTDQQGLTVAMDANATDGQGNPLAGNAIVAWLRLTAAGVPPTTVEARVRPAGKDFRRAKPLPAEPGSLEQVRAAIAGGNTVVAWTNRGMDGGTIQVVTGSSLTNFEPAENISPSGQAFQQSADVAIDADGNAIVVWENASKPFNGLIQGADNGGF